MPVTLDQLPAISEGDSDVCSIDFQDYLDAGETLAGTPTVVEVGTADLTLANKTVNAAALVVLGRSVGIGQAVQFRVSGQIAGKMYRVRVTVTTTSSRIAVRDAKFGCR